MRVVPLASSPNQAFTATIDGVRWGLRLSALDGCMAADISRDGELLLSGARVLSGEALIPYKYLEKGNFIFITVGGSLPFFEFFNQTQILVYVGQDEIDAIPSISIQDIAGAPAVQYLVTDEGFYLTTDTGEILTND